MPFSARAIAADALALALALASALASLTEQAATPSASTHTATNPATPLRRLCAAGRRSNTVTRPEPDAGRRAPAGVADRRDVLITEASSPPKQLHTPTGRATLPVQTVH